jgi:hypothetical protein
MCCKNKKPVRVSAACDGVSGICQLAERLSGFRPTSPKTDKNTPRRWTKTMNIQTLYDSDFNSWIQQHIVLLKESRFNEIDTAHLIEELEDMGKSNKRELKSRLIVLVAHLLKWQFQAEQRSASWEVSINEQRRKLLFLLKEIPSLKGAIDSALTEIYADAVEWASAETKLAEAIFPAQWAYSKEQLLDKNFYPDN